MHRSRLETIKSLTRFNDSNLLEPINATGAHYDGTRIQMSATNPTWSVALTRVFTGREQPPSRQQV